MNREQMKRIRESKAEATLLVRYANAKSRNKPTAEQVLEVLKRHIPYCGTIRPAIEKFVVTYYNANAVIKTARFRVELDNGKAWEITAYQNFKGRTPEEREADKTATFPSGLFNIFHDEIKQETEPEQKEEDE